MSVYLGGTFPQVMVHESWVLFEQKHCEIQPLLVGVCSLLRTASFDSPAQCKQQPQPLCPLE